MCDRLEPYVLVLVYTFLLNINLVIFGMETEETPASSLSPTTSTSSLPAIDPALNILDLKSTECKDLNPSFTKCDFNTTCVYGELNTVNCHVDQDIPCKGGKTFDITFPCLYCWQLPDSHYSCASNTTCKANSRYLTTCNVNSTTYCLGHREFSRYKVCNVTVGREWSKTFVISMLCGGFGFDRFYLGYWQEGVGKFFSFGGFGVWTLIDTILISVGYLKPADSSSYG